jgi:hypothetical protein
MIGFAAPFSRVVMILEKDVLEYIQNIPFLDYPAQQCAHSWAIAYLSA